MQKITTLRKTLHYNAIVCITRSATRLVEFDMERSTTLLTLTVEAFLTIVARIMQALYFKTNEKKSEKKIKVFLTCDDKCFIVRVTERFFSPCEGRLVPSPPHKRKGGHNDKSRRDNNY